MISFFTMDISINTFVDTYSIQGCQAKDVGPTWIHSLGIYYDRPTRIVIFQCWMNNTDNKIQCWDNE